MERSPVCQAVKCPYEHGTNARKPAPDVAKTWQRGYANHTAPPWRMVEIQGVAGQVDDFRTKWQWEVGQMVQ